MNHQSSSSKCFFSPKWKKLLSPGGQEHRNLKLSQFVREKDHWKYIETGLKNFRGGVADLRRENKSVPL